MKKRFFGILLMGAMVVASMSTFTSCKDYDDDIARIEKSINENSEKIKAIQALISNGGVITSVTPIGNGVRVTMSGDKPNNFFDILNGKDGAQGEQGVAGQNGMDGKDGIAWTIGQDGFWYQNGEKTEFYALGTTAVATTTTVIEASPKYYMPNPVTGCFDIYQDGVKIESTSISFLGTGTITATMDKDNLTLYGIAGALGPNNSITISMSSALKSMVFVPYLYLDGIESIEYPWMADTILKMYTQPKFPNLGHHGTSTLDLQDISGELNDYYPNMLGRYYNRTTGDIELGFATTTAAAKKAAMEASEPQMATRSNQNRDREYIYGPAWEVDYHLNPANAKIDYATNAPDYNVLEPEVVYYNTRATDGKKYTYGTFSVSSPENFWTSNFRVNEKKIAAKKYNNNEGILEAGIQITAPIYLAPWPTDETINPNGKFTVNKTTEAYGNDVYGPYSSWYGFARYEKENANKDNTVALQVKKTDGDETTITSDYALIVPTRVQLEGLIWDKKPQYIEPNMPGYNYGPGNQTGDEEGWADAKRVHVWDTPEEAIADPRGASLELGAKDAAGVDLKPYLGIHIVKENLFKKEREDDNNIYPGDYTGISTEVLTLHYGEEAAFGLHYEFELVEYISSTNKTSDSKYATFSDWSETTQHAYNNVTYDIVKDWNKKDATTKVVNTSKTGVIIARDVTPDGYTATTQSRSAVDREPLVRVLVKNEDGAVLLDGYILLHIFYNPDNLLVDNYPEIDKKFDLCNPVQFETTWSEFSRYILTDKMSEAERLAFDDWYWADCFVGDEVVPVEDERYVTEKAYKVMDAGVDDAHQRGYQLKIFNLGKDIWGNDAIDPVPGGSYNDYEEKSNVFEKKALGDMVYYPNGEGSTNHIFKWVISEEELEYLTHDQKTEGPIKVTRWFRYIAKDLVRGRDANLYSSAPYPYVWVKVTMNITRDNKDEHYQVKNTNYWYNWNPKGDLDETKVTDGWSAIVLDIMAPRDGETTKGEPWNSRVSNTLVENKVDLSKTKRCKYYFAPKGVYELTALNGKKYEITPENRTYTDQNYPEIAHPNTNYWNQLFCKYVWPHTYVDMNEPNYTTLPAKDYYATATYLSQVKTAQNKHEWKEADLENTLKWCSIIYNDVDFDNDGTIDQYAGAFNNQVLYAKNTSTNVYTPIARIKQQEFVKANPATWPDAGVIELIHWLPIGSTYQDYLAGNATLNTVCEDVLNAIGYPMKEDGTCDFDYAHKYLMTELHAWLGVVAVNDCNVAVYMDQVKHDDDNVATFVASWQRPINISTETITPALDANTQENYIFLVDYLKMFDWRGNKPHQGYMWDDHYYFWAYYNVHQIDVDMRPASILTNMHQKDADTFVPLNKVTTQAILTNIDVLNPGTGNARLVPDAANLKSYVFDLVGGAKKFTYAVNNDALKDYMGVGTPNIDTNKARFGGFYYANNGDNVTEFDVIIPITVHYEWGYVNAKVKWHINTTHR